MQEVWTVVTVAKTWGSVRKLKSVYGQQALVSRVGVYNLIHLDAPDRGELRRREEAFDPERLLEEDFPLRRELKSTGVDVIFLGRKRQDG